MNKIFVISILSICMHPLFGQAEKANYKVIADAFQENYNAGKFDSIFSGFSKELQAALPIEKTREFLGNLKSQAGKIREKEFIKYQQTYASYKAGFEKTILSVNISVDDNGKINGLFIRPFKEFGLPVLDRNTTQLMLPFKKEWTVVWGGDTKELNYHVENNAQKNAFDLVIMNDAGRSYRTDGKTNEDYYAFGEELIAPCDGKIVLVVDGIKDNVPGSLNRMYVPGNTIILQTGNNEYLFFAHCKQHSIVVKEGQAIQKGQLLGLCGNSGNSSEPHLHFHIQNVEDINLATGVKCYFNNILVNGQYKKDYSPIQKEKISNATTD